MACLDVLIGGKRAILCMRGQRKRRCGVEGCKASSSFLCDGHTDATNPETHRPDVCDLAICSAHATQIGEGRDLCPRCADNARRVFVELRDRVLQLGEAVPLAMLPSARGIDWPEDRARPRLLIEESPLQWIWYVRPGHVEVHRLRVDADTRWQIEKLPGVLAL